MGPTTKRLAGNTILARLGSTFVLLPLVALILGVGGHAWIAMVAVIAALGALELDTMARAVGSRPVRGLSPVLAAAIVLAAAAPVGPEPTGILAAGVVASFIAQLMRSPQDRSVTDWGLNVAIPAYMGVLAAYGVYLRMMPSGLAWTTILLVLVWSNDSAAYLAGRLFGRTKLAPSLSPKKTWEGWSAGALVTVAIALAVPAVAAQAPVWLDASGPAATPRAFLGAIGLAIAIVAPLGDLSKSFLKRAAGVKDAGRLIPGHGGVLDRADSLLFTAPLLHGAVTYLTGLLAAAP